MAAGTMPVMAIHERKTRRWTRAEYDRLIDLGVFQPGDPIELIGGELLVAEPQGAPHYTAIQKTARALERAFGPSWNVRTQGPMGLDEESEPEPDVAVVPGKPEDYGSSHPSRAELVVEVSESSLAFDRGHKGSVYARAGIVDYWIVNLVDRVVEVYREPALDVAAPFGASYARREVLDSSRQVSPLAAPHASIHVRDLFV
jgi:Uma2 family endonuclease